MIPNQATRARRREAGRTGHQLPAAMANGILWDVILQLNPLVPSRVPIGVDDTGGIVLSKPIPWYPVVRFRGHYFLVDHGNPWPSERKYCRLLGRPGNPWGDLCVTADGLVSVWSNTPGRRWEKARDIVGVQDDIEPVLSLPVAGAITAAGTVRPAVPGAVPGHDEQLHGRIRRRLPGGDQSQLHQEKAG